MVGSCCVALRVCGGHCQCVIRRQGPACPSVGRVGWECTCALNIYTTQLSDPRAAPRACGCQGPAKLSLYSSMVYPAPGAGTCSSLLKLLVWIWGWKNQSLMPLRWVSKPGAAPSHRCSCGTSEAALAASPLSEGRGSFGLGWQPPGCLQPTTYLGRVRTH